MGHPIGDAIMAETERRLSWAAAVMALVLFGFVGHAITVYWDSVRAAEKAPQAVVTTPLFDAHCRSCKQCGGGLLDENGEEQGICVEGWRLWKEDTRPK